MSIFLIGLIVGQFASGLSAQASGSRLLCAMGRDGALLALKLDVTTSTSFINFGAFLAFSLVNLFHSAAPTVFCVPFDDM